MNNSADEPVVGGRRALALRFSNATRDQVTRSFAPANLALAPWHDANSRERLLLVLAGLFVLTGTVALSLAELDHWSTIHWALVGAWIVCFGAAHLVLCRFTPDRDPMLLPLAGLLTGWGLLLIARLADVTFLLRQCIWLAVSVIVFLLVAARSPGLRWLRRYRYTWLLGGLALLATTLVLGANPSGFGPRLWLGGRVFGLGRAYIQPSEVLKLLLVAYLSSYLAEKRELVLDGPQVGWRFRGIAPAQGRFTTSPLQETDSPGNVPTEPMGRTIRLPSLPYLAPLLVMWGLAMVLLAWQQDLGAALLFFFTFLVMLYMASDSWSYVIAGILLFLIASAGAYAFLDTVALRVDIWLNPWADPDGRAFQVVQSLIAFASGGIIGQGLGQGSPTYIPAIHTDFPFAAIAEEFGLLGILGLIAAISALTLRGMRIALHARTPFRRLLAAGLAALLSLQGWIIMAGNSKLIPLTGVTLPFVSYGGSSLLSSFIALALLTTISRDATAGVQAADGSFRQPLNSAMSSPIRRMSLALLAAFAGLAVISGYWTVIRHDALWTRGDNPRLVETEQRVARGSILDRHNVVLARSQAVRDGVQSRSYLTPTIPAVGYYSLKHGVGGIEASADAVLRGLQGRSDADRFFDRLLHRQPEGRDVVLTLDAGLHQEIAMVMAPPGPDGLAWEGAVVLIDVESGAILALASQPTYNPNTLDADWERLESDLAAPLVNRATQGLYQPGGVLQLVVLAAALEADVADLDAPLHDPTRPIMVDGQSVGCAHAPQGLTLRDAVVAVCPDPIATLGARLGGQALETALRLWGLDAPPLLEIDTGAGTVQVTDPRLAAVGQEALTVSPLHMVMVVAAIGNGGIMPPAHLVLKTESNDGKWQPTSPQSAAVRVTDSGTADRLRALLRPSDDDQVLGHGSLALAGVEGPSHAWFLGLAPLQDPRYAIAVLVEYGGAEGLILAEKIGHDTLLAALSQTP